MEPGLPSGALTMVEVFPRKFPIGKHDVLLHHELNGVVPTVARRDGDRGVGDIFHGTVERTVIFGSSEPVRPEWVISPDGVDVIRLYILGKEICFGNFRASWFVLIIRAIVSPDPSFVECRQVDRWVKPGRGLGRI